MGNVKDLDLEAAKRLAFGRIMRLLSRPFRGEDVEDYYRCRAILMTDAPEFYDVATNYARDRNKGAAGD